MTRRHRWQNLAPAPVRAGVRAVVENATEPELLIYDYIDSWGGEWGVSAAEVVAALLAIGDVPALTVRLSSGGGDYFEGVSIYNALVRHPAAVTVHVDSLAASAASVIAMAGSRVVMGMGAQIMIHEAATAAWGRAEDFRAVAAMLDQTNDDIAGFYAARTGGDQTFWREAVRSETWYTARQAVEAGLADEVITPPRGAAAPAPDEAPENAARPATELAQPAAEAVRPPTPDAPDGEPEQTPDASSPAPDSPPEHPAPAFDAARLREALREATR